MNQFITPILLGYVNRYIKNFQPNDWQVSLWEGDATFNNLELRPEVLEEDFKVPFSLVSGQIYELLIHVPWTRLTWEPVVVTLNTVECILKIRNGAAPVPQPIKRQDSENPPSYIQSLVSKILNNITVVCNNLSIKYIEEDIVLSMHVRTLTFRTADKSWNPAFSEITEPALRKKISVTDLTVCLDKRNASGKIEAYHEPVLYRSSLEFRLLMYYRGQPDGKDCNISDLRPNRPVDGGWASEDSDERDFLVVRLDIRATQILDFQLNEEQLPMFFRLCELCRALAKGDLPKSTNSSLEENVHFGSSSEKNSSAVPTVGPMPFGTDQDNERGLSDTAKTGWTEYFSSLLSSTEEMFDVEMPMFEPQIWDFGFFVEKLSLELKVMDRGQEHTFYGPTKVVRPCTSPFASIVLHGVSAQLLKLGCHKRDDEGAKTMFNLRLGASRVLVEPIGGNCPCGTRDGLSDYSEDSLGNSVKDKNEPFFIFAGGDMENYEKDSLFDDKSSENAGILRPYNCSRVHHLETVTETAMLERTPALALDFMYTLEAPCDWDLESVSKLRDLEYSNFNEESLVRLLLGPARVKICASFLHRLQLLMHLASQCDYPPYFTPASESHSDTPAIPLPSEEERKAFESNSPADIYRITLFRPFIQFYLNDHPEYKPGAPKIKKKMKKLISGQKFLQFEDMPSVSFQSKYIDAKIVIPMYPRRMAETTKGLQKIPSSLMDTMYNSSTVEVTDVACHVILEGRQTTALFLNGINYVQKDIILPNFWSQKDLTITEKCLQCESFRVASTKFKLDIIIGIISSFFITNTMKEHMRIISMIPLATADQDFPMADASLEGISIKYLKTQHIEAYHLSISSVKVLLLKADSHKGDLKQTLILSGPEEGSTKDPDDTPITYLLKVTLQKKLNIGTGKPVTKLINPLLAFQINHAHLCIDQLLIDWLSLMPNKMKTGHSVRNGPVSMKRTPSGPPRVWRRAASEEAPTATVSSNEAANRCRRASTSSSSRTIPPAPPESVHSSSERGTGNNRHFSGGQPIYGSASALAEVEENEDFLDDSLDDLESNRSNKSVFEWFLEVFKTWCGATIVGKMKKWTAYIPATIGDECISSEGTESIPQTVADGVSSGKAIGSLLIELPSLCLHSAGVQGEIFLKNCFTHFPVKTTFHNLEKNLNVNFPWSVSMNNLVINTIHSAVRLPLLKPVTTILTIGVTTSALPALFIPGGSLNLCIHVDTSAVMFSISELQWDILTNITKRLYVLIPPSADLPQKEDIHPEPPIFLAQSFVPSPSSAASFQPGSSVSASEQSSVKINKDASFSCGVKMAALVQWTLARIALSVYARPHSTYTSKQQTDSSKSITRKLSLVLEDLMTSVDVKEVYLKIDSKVASARITHYQRSGPNTDWKSGPYLGLVMRCNEDSPSSTTTGNNGIVGSETNEGQLSKDKLKLHPSKSHGPFPVYSVAMNQMHALQRKENGLSLSSGNPANASGGFLVVTFTQAQCQSVHQKWGRLQKRIDSQNITSSCPNSLSTSSITSHPNTEQNYCHASNPSHHDKSQSNSINQLPDVGSSQSSIPLQAFDSSRYVSELSVCIQPLDIVFSSENLQDFWVIFSRIDIPFSSTSAHSRVSTQSDNSFKNKGFFSYPPYSNINLPLLYVDAHNIRLILPSSKLTKKISQLADDVDRESAAVTGFHDVCILQVDRINVAPQVENPIGRVPIRSDIYSLAEEARILGIPGSLLEDRQYQIQIHNISINSGMWYELEPCFEKDPMVSYSYVRGENPALEWSKLAKGRSCLAPEVSVLPLINRFDLCITAAPAVVYQPPSNSHSQTTETLVCGYGMEVHAASNIDACASTYQVGLLAEIATEFISLSMKDKSIVENNSERTINTSVSCETLHSAFLSEREDERIGDSGVDVSSSGCFGTPVTKSHASQVFHSNITEFKILEDEEKRSDQCLKHQVTVPVEIFFTSEKVTLVLYDVTGSSSARGRTKENAASRRKHYAKRSGVTTASRHGSIDSRNQRLLRNSSDLGYDGSEEGSVEDGPTGSVSFYVQPLLHFFITEPHTVLSLAPSSQKFQFSVFDTGLRTSGSGYVVQGGGQKLIPRIEDFHVQILETKSGDRHPKTGIPPSFLTITWTDVFTANGKVKIEIDRPTKLNVSVPRWKYIRDVLRRLSDCTKCLQVELLSSTEEPVYQHKRIGGQYKDAPAAGTLLSYLKSCSLSLSTVQLVVVIELVGRNGGLQREKLDEVTLALGSFHANVWSVEGLIPWELKSRGLNVESINCRVQGNVKASSITASIFHYGKSKVLLYPWSFSIDGSIIWEPWMNQSCPPRIQINADSETISLDIGPDHLVFLKSAVSEFMAVISPAQQHQYDNSEMEKESSSKDEMHSVETCPKSTSMEEFIPVKMFNQNVKQLSHSLKNPSVTSISYHSHSSGISDPSSPAKEQHYQDDLRAGAFLFIDGTATQTSMPFPYQVVFNNSPPTMAWCYPEPRTLTKVHVYPVPFVNASEPITGMSSAQQIIDQVVCSLQYWCECRNQFMDYCHFYLSESTYTRLDLPSLSETGRLSVARTWRVQLQLRSKADNRDDGINRQQVTLSPRSLAGCMRVDSYFSPALIPTLEASLNLSSFHVTLFNHLTHISKKMPKPLNTFTYDEAMPESQPFSTASLDGVELFVTIKEPYQKSKEHPASLVANSKGHIQFNVIDSAFLTQQCVIQPFLVEAQAILTDYGSGNSKNAAFNLLCRPITIIFGAAPAHTLAVSVQLWNDVLNHMSEDEKAVPNNRCMVLVTKYLICNDTMQPIRFGQYDTKECIQLLSRQCHFYSWFTQKKKQKMTFEIEKNNNWTCTSPICLDYEGTKLCRWFGDHPGINVFITIESLSTSQKKITVIGQLMVTNLLMEPVDLQIPYESWHLDDDSNVEEDKKDKREVIQALIVPVGAKSSPASILPPQLTSSHSSFFRIRFQGTDDGLASGSWSGKVPLLPDSNRGFMPYPVKVPLHERNHYYCVWCRVVYQKVENIRRILVVLSPLFAVRSFLPISAEVEVATPELRVTMHTIAKGRGTDQELYCPGTTATSHMLTFNLEDQHRFEVPMSYQMLQKTQQELQEIENSKDISRAPSIETVLKQLKESFKEPEPRWPYVGEEFNGVDWISGPLSQTDIEVSYVNPSPHCSTLLVQVRPKVLLANVLGVEIYLTSDVDEETNDDDAAETVRRMNRFRMSQALCSVPHHGVIAAPKLEGIFHLGIRLMENDDITDDEEKTGEEESGEMFFSPPLQLSTAEWAGNKPHISGVVPLEGSARTRIFCGKYVCFLTVTSVMTPYGVRVLTIRPMYTVCNHTLERLRLSALCIVDVETGTRRKRKIVPQSSLLLDIPPGEGEDNGSRSVADGKIGHILGWPVILWSIILPDGNDSKHEGHLRCISEQNLEPYIQFGMDGSSGELLSGCPMKIGMSPENPVLGVTQSAQPRRMCFTIPVVSSEEKNGKTVRLMNSRAKVQTEYQTSITNRPLAMTIHEKEGQSFLLVHDDPCPQMELQNLCNFDILVGEAEKNMPGLGPSDAEHFHWLTVIQSGTSAFYSLPSRSLNFPDIYSSNELATLVLAGGDSGLNEESLQDMWSECIRVDDRHLSDPEGQFLRLFPGCDIRVRIEERHNQLSCPWGKGCSTLVTIEPAPRASVLAKDVRERLGATFEPSTSSQISFNNTVNSNETNISTASYSTKNVLLDIQDRYLNSPILYSSKLVAVDDSNIICFDSCECHTLSFLPSSFSFLLSSYKCEKVIRNNESRTADTLWLLSCTCLMSGVRFSLVDDLHLPWERTEVILLSLDDICLTAESLDISNINMLQLIVSVGDCQLDNQRHVNYDFPVILIRDGTSYKTCLANTMSSFSLLSKPASLVEEARKEALFKVTAGMKLGDSFNFSSFLQTIEINVRPIRVYLEDRFDLYLMDICLSLLPSSLLFPHSPQSFVPPQFSEARDFIPPDQFPPPSPWSPGHVFLPHGPFLESLAVAKPLRLKMLAVGPVSLLVSLHTYAGVYIAANHSPLQFSAFERTQLFTSSYELGRALTLHYRSGVLLCAGWMLGSLELLGSPGGLACTVGRGIRDFLHLPLAGILQGPWGFVLGMLHGSASLMKHITAGTVTSVTMLASSVARNLDQLTLDEEYMRLTEEVRRRPPKGVAQGLLRGLTGLGISLLGAVGGIVYHPMQSMVNEGSQSLVSGVGKGLVGVITKPLSGAVELVALTGQGLLHGTGWANLPLPRQSPLKENINEANDSQLKYIWKILPLSLASCSFIPPSTFSTPELSLSQASLNGFKCLMIMEAMSVSSTGICNPVTLILTAEGLLIVELEPRKDATNNNSSGFFWISLKEVSGMEPSTSDPTLLRLQLIHMIEPVTGSEAPAVSARSRIVEYVRNSSVLVCPVQVSGGLGPSTLNDWTAVPPAADQVSTPSSAPNISQDSSRSQSPSLPHIPRSSSPDPSTSARSSFPSLIEKSGSCSAEPSDQPMTNYDDSSCQLYQTIIQPSLPLNFYVAPAAGVHFLSLLKLVKRQSVGKGYPVL